MKSTFQLSEQGLSQSRRTGVGATGGCPAGMAENWLSGAFEAVVSGWETTLQRGDDYEGNPELSSLFYDFKFSFIGRTCNKVAHVLAKQVTSETQTGWWQFAPDCVSALVTADCNSMNDQWMKPQSRLKKEEEESCQNIVFKKENSPDYLVVNICGAAFFLIPVRLLNHCCKKYKRASKHTDQSSRNRVVGSLRDEILAFHSSSTVHYQHPQFRTAQNRRRFRVTETGLANLRFFLSSWAAPQTLHLRMKTVNSVGKLLNRFLFLHLKYENESESGQAGHENEHELKEYLKFRKRTNSSGIMSNTVGMRKFNTKYRPTVHSIKQVHDQIHNKFTTNKCMI